MSSLVKREVDHFAKDSARWWDEEGPFKPLHRLNPARLSYIRERICSHYPGQSSTLKPFEGLDILDIGCGGGLVCEPMARLGGRVTGLDADEGAIAVARDHAAQSGLEIEYICGAVENLISPSPSIIPSPSIPLPEGRGKTRERQGEGYYDVVLALEIIEHVADPAAFVQSVAELVKPGGRAIFSTLNRTAKSYALGIWAAEYLLQWVPQGTHRWGQFIKPAELAQHARAANLIPDHMTGLVFRPLSGTFALSRSDLDVSYLLSAIKGR